MITIIGDTSDELATLQYIINTGILNASNDNNYVAVDVTYKLSSGDKLLVNQYDYIVGSSKTDESEVEE